MEPLLLLAFLMPPAVASATATAAELEPLRGQLAELQQLVLAQQALIGGQQERLRALEADAASSAASERRLNGTVLNGTVLNGAVLNGTVVNGTAAAILAPSIFGNLPGERTYTEVESLQGALTHLWLLLCGTLVVFMQAGFAMMEVGCSRLRNVQRTLLKNLTVLCIGTLGWWMCGWSLAYGGPFANGSKLYRSIGYEHFFGSGFLEVREDGQQEPTADIVKWVFQWAVSSVATAIASGGLAERLTFPGSCICSLLLTGFIYPVVVASTWGHGWLKDINAVGYVDFAGSGVVHVTGGCVALAGAILAGPRGGRFQGQGLMARCLDTPEGFAPHSMPLIVLGTFMLWFGWYGLNCGSTLSMVGIEQGFLAAQVAMNTTIAAASGGLVAFALRLAMLGRHDVSAFCKGVLAGLVSISAACASVECGSACIIGVFGASICQLVSVFLRLLKIDDPVDRFAVHGAAGAWGVCAAAIFDWGSGLDAYHGPNGFRCVTIEADASGACADGLAFEGIAANLVGVGCIILWAGACSALVFLPLRFFGFVKASEEGSFDEVWHCPSKAYNMMDLASQEVFSSLVLPSHLHAI